MRIPALLGALALALTGSVTVAPAANAAPSCPPGIEKLREIGKDVADGLDVTSCGVAKTVVQDGVGVQIPAPGAGITAIAVRGDGAETELTVRTDDHGVVSVTTAHAEQSSTRAAAAAVNRCSDGGYVLMGTKWYKTASFAVNSSERRPSNISLATWEKTVTDSLATVTNGRNACGRTVNPSLTTRATMRTTADANIGGTNVCTTPNSASVIDFGSLSGNVLGLTCAAFTARSGHDTLVAADIRMDSSSRSWVTTTTGCSGARYDLRSVLTHEMGHAVGLNHAPERGGNDLTMSPTITSCNASARTFGYGDLRGLMTLYPAT